MEDRPLVISMSSIRPWHPDFPMFFYFCSGISGKDLVYGLSTEDKNSVCFTLTTLRKGACESYNVLSFINLINFLNPIHFISFGVVAQFSHLSRLLHSFWFLFHDCLWILETVVGLFLSWWKEMLWLKKFDFMLGIFFYLWLGQYATATTVTYSLEFDLLWFLTGTTICCQKDTFPL